MTTITGTSANDTLTGTASADQISGLAGNDTLIGNDGNDLLSGGAGADQLIGGAGIDTASYSDAASAVSINLKTGIHTGIATGDTFSSIEIIQGSNYHDTFAGDASANNFNGGTGTDTIDYSSSTAAVNVNISTGVVSGGDAQGDTLTGIDNVIGSAFNDTLASATIGALLQGGAGDDIYTVNAANVIVTEAANGGTDEVRTSLASLSITGYANIENLAYTGTANFSGTGNSGNNTITGGVANDTLYGGGGADQFIGGTGTDTVSFANYSSGVNIDLKNTNTASDRFNGIENIVGSNYNDTLAGDANANNLNGGAGIDTISYASSAVAVDVNLTTKQVSGGDAQGDTLTSIEGVIGSGFNDKLTSSTNGTILNGGTGDDLYIINGTGVSISETAGNGVDEVQTTLATLSIVGYAEVEKLTYTGTAAFTGTGNSGNNVITGSVGNDTLYGGTGADEFHGGAGADIAGYADSTLAITLNFATGEFSGIAAGDSFYDIETIAGSNFNDVFIESNDAHNLNGGNGFDIVSYQAATSGITYDLQNQVFSAIAVGDNNTNVEIIQASTFADLLIGDAGNNNFMGGQGADSIDGGTGTDTAGYLNSSAAVQVNLLADTATSGDATGDELTNIENLIGSSYGDELVGDAANNRFDGGTGNDILDGGEGNDTLYGSFGSDYSITDYTIQADSISGGAGDDVIVTAVNDTGSIVLGGDGNDSITLTKAEAHGGSGDDIFVLNDGNGIIFGDDGNDSFTAWGGDCLLFGGAGSDGFALMIGTNYADGGEGSDTYAAYEHTLALIQDTGTTGIDEVQLRDVTTANLYRVRSGNDLLITSITDWNTDNHIDFGIRLVGWYANGNTVENLRTQNNDLFAISDLAV